MRQMFDCESGGEATVQRVNRDWVHACDTLPKDEAEVHLRWDKKRVRNMKRACIAEAEYIEKLRLGDASVVLPSMLRCIARQLNTVLYNNLPVEVQAGACRIVYELRDHASLMAQHPERVSKFLAQRWFNEQEMLKALHELHPVEWIQKRLQDVDKQIQTLGLTKQDGDSARRRAQLNRREKEHKAHYQLFSLYCHATAMLAAEEYQTGYQMGFIHKTQQYAWQCLLSIRACVEKLQEDLEGA